jgi:imidazolonepropionase
MNNKRWDAIWINCSIATMAAGPVAYGLLNDAAIAVKNGKVAWVGLRADLSKPCASLATVVHDLAGRCLTPGLIDCHTHLVYAGNRYREFDLRMQGQSYAEIARAGGGIRSTVAATREVSEQELFAQSVLRARALAAEGVTTVEIKSGYGLDLVTELKMLRVANQIGAELSLTVKKTFLGAHAVPAEFQGYADQYLDLVCHEMMPRIAKEKLADYVDVFCETIGFSLAQTERVFKAAQQYQLGIKCHAEQLSDLGGASLAAQYQALSADHLEYISADGVNALAQSGTVAVLLPGAFYFLREKQLPPVALLRASGVPMAVATDCNPGTSPVTSILLMLNMACVLFGLTPEEALSGVTRHAAAALGLQHSHGTLEIGKVADFAIWDVQHPAELVYFVGLNPLYDRVVAGLRKRIEVFLARQ